MDPSEGTAAVRSRGRLIAFRVLAVLFGLGALGGLFGAGLIVGWFDTTEGGIHRVHDIGFGVLAGVFVTVGFLSQLRNPERQVSTRYQIVAAAVAALIAGFLSSDPGPGLFFFLIPLVALAILVAVHPPGAALMRAEGSFSLLLALPAVAGAIPLTWFALTAAKLQRTGLANDPHVEQSHWTIMASMALAIVLVALLSAMRLPGWRISAWCAGGGAFFYGLASVVFATFPGTTVPYPGSEGVSWGLVAILGGLVFIAVAEWEARQPRVTR